MQGLYVLFQTPEGPRQRFVAPKTTTQVPSSWGGKAIDNLIRRRMIKVVDCPDPTPEPIPERKPVVKRSKTTQKSN